MNRDNIPTTEVVANATALLDITNPHHGEVTNKLKEILDNLYPDGVVSGSDMVTAMSVGEDWSLSEEFGRYYAHLYRNIGIDPDLSVTENQAVTLAEESLVIEKVTMSIGNRKLVKRYTNELSTDGKLTVTRIAAIVMAVKSSDIIVKQFIH